MQLTKEQQQAIVSGENVHISVEGLDCVLIRSDVFERISRVVGDWTAEEMRLALGRSSLENGWDEPGMEAYDRLVE